MRTVVALPARKKPDDGGMVGDDRPHGATVPVFTNAALGAERKGRHIAAVVTQPFRRVILTDMKGGVHRAEAGETDTFFGG